jgi:hypothetical protein
MEDKIKEIKTETKKKTTAKKKAEPKTEPKKEGVDMSTMMTPEMMAMFMKFMESQQQEVKPMNVKEEKWTKASLYNIKNEMVEVRNVLDGKVVYVSPKTKLKYKWLEKGDIEILSVEEILAMDSKKIFLRTPVLVIDDERVIEGLGLGKVYRDIELIENTEKLEELDIDELKEFVEGLSDECKNNLRDEMNKKINNYEIRDYMVVDTLKGLLDL